MMMKEREREMRMSIKIAHDLTKFIHIPRLSRSLPSLEEGVQAGIYRDLKAS